MPHRPVKRAGDGEMVTDPFLIGSGLRSLRRRRCLLWAVILLYVPEIWVTLAWTHSGRAALITFYVWFLFLWNTVILVAFTRCPRCRNYYHIKFAFPLYFRHCRHCGLAIDADKRGTL
ncbi:MULTISPECIES: hypothetical protein [Geobacter]|uniref:hypothetical protein n=1 Tax=Geobacter TaxID=28231 RepID=UPI002573AFF8|nr:hypothetical protein [Geobacter sulfurreducens]BEH09455.1 hypothetical protein GSUET_10670 [Geobacter sulfurreducens subsp. ethanolicus]BET57336.1 hypothetical protein GEO60473_03760 [Geobacter sp. 60473]